MGEPMDPGRSSALDAPLFGTILRRQLQASCFVCERIPLSEMNDWIFDGEALRHRTGGFFSIAGIRSSSFSTIEQPMIIQPDIGILAFFLRRSDDDVDLLVQAKTEPGNLGATQFAPTFQCTVSNYTRLHGGRCAPYFESLLHGQGNIISDSLQSEQGTRFFRKNNRNIVKDITGAPPIEIENGWTWISIKDVRRLMLMSNSLNTDARSVLACTDWNSLTLDGKAFGRWRTKGGFGEALLESFEVSDDKAENSKATLEAWIEERRKLHAFSAEITTLASLKRWQCANGEISCREGGSFAIRGFNIQALDREVSRWHQPLIDSPRAGVVSLLCQRRKGIIHFLIQATREIGYANYAQIGASVQISPGEIADIKTAELQTLIEHNAIIHLSCRQSEEGGRFFQDINDYIIAEVTDGVSLPFGASHCWVTLNQLYHLVAQQKMVSNELRSAISLLLSAI